MRRFPRRHRKRTQASNPNKRNLISAGPRALASSLEVHASLARALDIETRRDRKPEVLLGLRCFLKGPKKAVEVERGEAPAAAPRLLPVRGPPASGITPLTVQDLPCAHELVSTTMAGPDFSLDQNIVRIAGNGCAPVQPDKTGRVRGAKILKWAIPTMGGACWAYKILAALRADTRRGIAATWP